MKRCLNYVLKYEKDFVKRKEDNGIIEHKKKAHTKE